MTSEITTGLFTLAGALLGGFIALRAARYISRLNARGAAAAELRAAFAHILAKLRLARLKQTFPDDPVIDAFLADGLPGIAATVENFRAFIVVRDRSAYQEAWEQYYQVATAGVVVASAHDSDPFRYIEKHIHAILRFAEP